MRRIRVVAAFAALCAAFTAHAQAPEVVTTFASGAANGRYAFASWTPKTLREAIDFGTLYAYNGTSGSRLQGEAYTTVLKSCGAVGATVEGSHRARDKAAQAAWAF